MTDTLWIAIAAAALIGVAIGALIVFLARPKTPEKDTATEQHVIALDGRLQTMAEMLTRAQAQLQQTVNQRLDTVTQHLGQSVQTSAKQTTDHLQQLHSRLAVIDSAQKNITDLASTVSSLQKVLDNKQRRGAFGQGRMESIISDGLPKGAYEFQFTLSNRSRPDCCIKMPDNRPLVIDAKFPLEAITAIERSTTDEQRVEAARLLRQHLGKHIGDIADKYLIPGETQEMALMFVPSESFYAELHDGFDDIIQKAYRARVMIVSPSLLMLAVQVIQQIQKDAKMREAADKILVEVGLLVTDVTRMRDRVENLEKHFGNVSTDIKQIVISADKIVQRGERIQTVEFGSVPTADVIPGPGARRLAGE